MKGFMISLFLLILTACAGVDTRPTPPALDLRTLDLSYDEPGFIYQYEVCTKTGLFGKCREWSITKELYDLNDPAIRNKLKDIGFVGKVREKPIH